MNRTGRKKEWSILLFVVCLIAFVPPVLTIFDKPGLVFGIPLSILYLFGTWSAVIIFTAIGAHRRSPEERTIARAKVDDKSAASGPQVR
ncbi:MAG: hypothetical protein COB93_04030 [Sneathiella sp.]|nr:MAG: hypothetical protein COB93_04030 [Sneathiella sp.]